MSNVSLSAIGYMCKTVALINLTFSSRENLAGFAMTHAINGANFTNTVSSEILQDFYVNTGNNRLYCDELSQLALSGATISGGLITTRPTQLTTLQPTMNGNAFAVAYSTEASMPHHTYLLLNQKPTSFLLENIQKSLFFNNCHRIFHRF